MKTCTLTGCERKHYGRGLCNKHYLTARKTGQLDGRYTQRVPVSERLRRYSKVNAKNGCHEWIGSRQPQGYGNIRIGNKTLLAHRVSWELVNGEIPEGMIVCHQCDNPSCINPEHLFLGTHLDNAIDRNSKNRQASHKGALNGRAILTEEQIIDIRGDTRTQKDIASAYGMGESIISAIKRGLAWSHVA